MGTGLPPDVYWSLTVREMQAFSDAAQSAIATANRKRIEA